MKAENLILHHSRQRQVVEQIGQVLPHVSIAVLAQAFIVEAINLCDLATLVISAQNGDPVLEAHFEADK